MKRQKLLQKLFAGSKNIRFNELTNIVESLGFELVRINGSHHIYQHPDIPEMVNLQDVGGKAVAYQIRQVLKLIERHDLRLEDED